MNSNQDPEAVISVDWTAVEEETGTQYPEEVRRIVEREGSASSVVLDRWGYKDYAEVAFSAAIWEYGQTILPELGPVPTRYISLRGCNITGCLQVELYDADLNIGELTESVDDEITFSEGLTDLVEAAMEIDDLRDDWHLHPSVGHGSFGPDRLGNCYLTVGHKERDVLENINIDSFSIKQESLKHLSEKYRSDDFEEHYRITFRHSRYETDEDEPEFGEHQDKADEIGLLGSNLGTRTSIVTAFKEQDIEYEQIKEITAKGISTTVYKYEKEDETRWAVEWSKRIAIDDYVVKSLIFNREPNTDTVEQAALIIEATN